MRKAQQWRRVWPAAYIVGILLALGCAPQVSYRVDTVVAPNHACERRVAIAARPNPRLPNQRVKLRDYLEFAEAEVYENFVLLPDRALLNGSFASPEEVPSDFGKTTMGTDRVARNRIHYRATDLVLIEVIDYEEEISDIVDRQEGEAALARLANVATETLCKIVRDRCEGRYDTAALEEYLRQNLPALCQRLYVTLWEIRRARRSGLSGHSERQEWEQRLWGEIARLTGETMSGEQGVSKSEALKAIERKLQELVKPRPGADPITLAFLSGEGGADQPTQWQAAIVKQYGSWEKFMSTVDPLLPQAFGAFFIRHFSLMPVNPQFDFQMRLSLPGEILQTNGIRDLDGRILWNFTDDDLALSGHNMWARALVVRKDDISSLGLVDFPGHLEVAERFYQELRAPGGGMRESLLQALRAGVAEKSLAPLTRLAAGEKENSEQADDTRAAAQRLLAFLKKFQPGAEGKDGPEMQPGEDRRRPDDASSPAPPPQGTAPEERQPGE